MKVSRYDGDLEALRMALRLRLRQTREAKVPSGFGAVYDYEIGWQERIASIGDLVDDLRQEKDGAREKLLKVCDILEERRHYIYTYVEEDSFRSWDLAGQGVVLNAKREAAPSVQTSTGALNASLSTLGTMSHFRKDAVQHAIRIQNREAVPTRFYIVAAVDVDLIVLRQICQQPSRINTLKTAPLNEIVLCAVAAYENLGRLEISPSFAVPDLNTAAAEKYRRDQGGDTHRHDTLREDPRVGTGLPLVTTRISTPTGIDLFEYVVERLPDKMKPGHHSELKAGIAPELQYYVDNLRRDALAVDDREKRFKLKMAEAPLPLQKEAALSTYQIALGVQMEIVRAQAFDDADWLCVDYEVHLPGHGWRALDNGVFWTSTLEGDQMAAGTTQVSRIDTPCTDRDYTGYLATLVSALFIFGILAGPSYSIFLIFGIGMVALSYGAHPNTCAPPEHTAAAYFNYPVELQVARLHALNDPRDAVRPTEIPRFYFQVWSRAAFSERYVIEGYCHCQLPWDASLASKEILLDVWKPVPDIASQLRDFFVGGAARLIDMRSAAYPPDEKASGIGRGIFKQAGIFSKTQLRTERTGTIAVRFNLRSASRPQQLEMKPLDILHEKTIRPRINLTQKPNSQVASSILSNDDNLLSEATMKSLREKFAAHADNPPDRDALRDVLAGLRATIAKTTSSKQAHSNLSADLIARDTSRPARERAAELIRLLQDERNSLRPYRMGVQVPHPTSHMIDPAREDTAPSYTSTRRKNVSSRSSSNAADEENHHDSPQQQTDRFTHIRSSDGGWAESKESPPP